MGKIICGVVYIVGMIMSTAFLLLISNQFGITAWLYAIGAEFGIVLFTAAICAHAYMSE